MDAQYQKQLDQIEDKETRDMLIDHEREHQQEVCTAENWLATARPAKRRDFQRFFLRQLQLGARWSHTPNDFDTKYNFTWEGVKYNRIVVVDKDTHITPLHGSSRYVILAEPGVKVTGAKGHNEIIYFDHKFKGEIQKPTDIFQKKSHVIIGDIINWSLIIGIATLLAFKFFF